MANNVSATDALTEASKLLAAALPEMKVRVLPRSALNSPVGSLPVEPKIAVDLPREEVGSRLTLLHELKERTGITFTSDSRSPYGACTFGQDPKAIFDAVHMAVLNNKLEGLTLDYLSAHTTESDRATATEQATALESHSRR